MNKENAAGIELELKETFDVQLSRAMSSPSPLLLLYEMDM